MFVDLEVVPIGQPDDTPTARVEGRRVVAVIGKTEGNGGVNDFSRGLAARAWDDALSGSPLTVMSGGTEGVLSPHVTLVLEAAGGEASGLTVGTAQTRRLAPAEVGRRAQVAAVARATIEACASAGLDPANARLVLVKCPLLTSDQIAADPTGVVSTSPYETMAYSRAASALGVGLGCGELTDLDVERALAGDDSIWSAVASASSGVELDRCHVLVLGEGPGTGGRLHARTVIMNDAIDVDPVLELRDSIRSGGGRVVQVFAKAEASPSGTIRGYRHTMLTDTDLSATRHARAAVGGLLAGVFGTTALYVSGGAERQGPPGGGPVTVVWASPGQAATPGPGGGERIGQERTRISLTTGGWPRLP